MILGFSHPAIVVDDLEKAREFYAEMFGFRVISEEGWSQNNEAERATGLRNSSCTGYMMAGHNCFLELFEFTCPQPDQSGPDKTGAHERGIRHLAFFVDDVDKETARFISLGGYALGTPTNGAVYLRDPFGNIIELCEVPNENENLLTLPGINKLNNTGL